MQHINRRHSGMSGVEELLRFGWEIKYGGVDDGSGFASPCGGFMLGC